MLINKKRFTEKALGFVEQGKEYNKLDVIELTACAMADDLYVELAPGMITEDISKLRDIFRGVATNCIDWKRIDRKVNPQEWADTIEYNSWPDSLVLEV